jgi:hypothetical protein
MGAIIISRFHRMTNEMKSTIGAIPPYLAEWETMVKELQNFKSNLDFIRWLYGDIHKKTYK